MLTARVVFLTHATTRVTLPPRWPKSSTAAPSPFCSRTSRARRGCSINWARIGTTSCSPRTRSSCSLPSPPTAARSRIPRATPTSWPSQPRTTRWPPPSTRSATWPHTPGPRERRSGCAWDCTPASPRSGPSVTSASVCTAPLASELRATAGRSCSRGRPRAWPREALPPGVTIRDLGERRLKDIEQPQHLYQLVVEGLQNEFAQLKTLDVELARKRRRLYAGAALIGVTAAAVAIPVFALGQGSSGGGVTVQGNAVALIDPGSNRVVGQVPNVGARPASIVYGSGSLWVANLDDQTVARIDPDTRSVERSVAVEETPTGLAASSGAVWVVGSNATSPSVTVRRIDPSFNTVSARTTIGNVVTGGPGSVAADGRHRLGGALLRPALPARPDRRPGREQHRSEPGQARPVSRSIRSGGAVWVTGGDANTVTRIDPTGLLTPIAVGHGPGGIAVGAGGVWVADTLDDAVVRIDPATRAVTTTIPVGRSPAGVAVGDGSVWVANSGDGTVTRIDPSGRRQPVKITVGGSPQGVVVENQRVWVTVDPQTIEPPRECEPRRRGTPPIPSASSIRWIPRWPTHRSPGSSNTPRARSSSTTRTRPGRQARNSSPRSPGHCRSAPQTARRTRSRFAKASASRRPRTRR